MVVPFNRNRTYDMRGCCCHLVASSSLTFNTPQPPPSPFPSAESGTAQAKVYWRYHCHGGHSKWRCITPIRIGAIPSSLFSLLYTTIATFALVISYEKNKNVFNPLRRMFLVLVAVQVNNNNINENNTQTQQLLWYPRLQSTQPSDW